MRIFIGNLAWSTTEGELERLFEPYGLVDRAQIAPASEPRRIRVGFVVMPNPTEAQAAIAGLQGTVLGGQRVTIRVARQQPKGVWRKRSSPWQA